MDLTGLSDLTQITDLYVDQFLMFLLVLTRISGLLMTAPMFADTAFPVRFRAMMAIGISLMVTPIQTALAVQPASLFELVVMAGRELGLGVTLGMAILILFGGLQLAGQVISQMSGMSLADLFDPGSQTSAPIYSQALRLIGMAAFLCVGGHRMVLDALLESFANYPPGQVELGAEMLDGISGVVMHSFDIGIRTAAPVVVSLLLSVIVMGLISRTLPQLNIIAVGFNLNAVVVLLTLAVSLGAIVNLFQQNMELAFMEFSEVIGIR